MAEGGQPCRDGVYGEPPRDPVESRRIGGRSQDSHIRGVELLSGAETSTRSAPYRLLRLREGLPSRRQRDVERAMDRPVPAPRAGSHRDGRERYGSQRAVLLRSRVKRGNGTGRRNSRPLFHRLSSHPRTLLGLESRTGMDREEHKPDYSRKRLFLLLGRNRHHPRSGPVRHTAEEPLRQL